MNIDKRLAKMEQIKAVKDLDIIVAYVSEDHVDVSNGDGSDTKITLDEWEQRKEDNPDATIIEAVWT